MAVGHEEEDNFFYFKVQEEEDVQDHLRDGSED